MATWPKPPPTRIISWAQQVKEADPNYVRLSLQPWVYEFSNGRLFVDTLPTYTPYDIQMADSALEGMTDSSGQPMYDSGNSASPPPPTALYLTDSRGNIVYDGAGHPVPIT
jgi:hypothetical protein